MLILKKGQQEKIDRGLSAIWFGMEHRDQRKNTAITWDETSRFGSPLVLMVPCFPSDQSGASSTTIDISECTSDWCPIYDLKFAAVSESF